MSRANKNRAAFMSEATPRKVKAIELALFRKAAKGDVKAVELYLRYAIGPAINLDILERLNELEAAAGMTTTKLPTLVTSPRIMYQPQ